MKKIKDIVLVGFAIVGFISVLSGFTEQQVYGTPESHQWEFNMTATGSPYFTHNKVTGEVRSFEIINTKEERKAIQEGKGNELIYRVGVEVK
jgi:hypothetical protein